MTCRITCVSVLLGRQPHQEEAEGARRHRSVPRGRKEGHGKNICVGRCRGGHPREPRGGGKLRPLESAAVCGAEELAAAAKAEHLDGVCFLERAHSPSAAAHSTGPKHIAAPVACQKKSNIVHEVQASGHDQPP